MRSEEADRTACLIRMITLIVGAVAAVLAIVAVTIYARRALKQALVVRSFFSVLFFHGRVFGVFVPQSVCHRRPPSICSAVFLRFGFAPGPGFSEEAFVAFSVVWALHVGRMMTIRSDSAVDTLL